MNVIMLKEYVQLLLAEGQKKRVREVEVTSGPRVPFGSPEHVGDLKRRMKELTIWRDRQPKGSERRAEYTRILNRVKHELKKATAKQHNKKL